MDNNLPIFRNYFGYFRWNLQEVINAEWTGDSESTYCQYLGANKNEAGECLNCTGVVIYKHGDLIIAPFNQFGKPLMPNI